MAVIRNRDEFERWLAGKPASWAQILACRAALRVVPVAVRDERWALLTFRAVGMSFAAHHLSAKDMRKAAAAYAAYAAAAEAADADAYAAAGDDAEAAAAYSAAYSAAADDAAYSAASAAAGAAADAVDAYAADAVDAARGTFWPSIVADATWLENVAWRDTAAEALTAQPLWLTDRPGWFDRAWQSTKQDLTGDATARDPWIGWFERRIAGHATAFALPRAADEAIQIRIAEQDDAFWERGRAAVNADIQAWIDAATPLSIPPQHPDELITTVHDGRVALVHVPPLPATPDQDQRRRDAWQAIREALNDYRADGPADNHPRLNRMIDRLATALGVEFDALNPVGLGIQAQYLQQYAARADDFLVADRAADLVGLNVTVGSLLPQFAEWRDYLADSDARSDVSAEALNAATAIVAAIAEQDVAEPDVNAVLGEMVAAANDEASIVDPDEPKLQTYRQRLIGGLGNTLATAGKIALGWGGRKLGALDKGIDKGLETVGEKATVTLFASVLAHLATLAGAVPELAWLGPIIAFFKSNAPKD